MDNDNVIQYILVINDPHYRGQNNFYYKSLDELRDAIKQIELDLRRRPEMTVYEAQWREMDVEEYG